MIPFFSVFEITNVIPEPWIAFWIPASVFDVSAITSHCNNTFI